MGEKTAHPFEVFNDAIVAWLGRIPTGPEPLGIWVNGIAPSLRGAAWVESAAGLRAGGCWSLARGGENVYLLPSMRTPEPFQAALIPCDEPWDEQLFERLLWAYVQR